MNMSAALTLNDLATAPLWVAWRNEMRDGRRTKVPYNPRSGQRAESNNANSWATRGEAEDWVALHGANGIGLVLGDDRIGIDLDSCRDPDTGDFTAWAQAIIDRFQSYTEISPSETGAKIFFRIKGDAATIERLFDGKHGRQFKNGNGGDHPPAIEIYRSNRYFTVTGDMIGEANTLREIPIEDLRWLIREHAPSVFSAKIEAAPNGHDNSRSAKAFRKGAALRPLALPMPRCAMPYSPMPIRKSPNGRGQKVWPTAAGKCGAFTIMRLGAIPKA
jgi:primase-polymerase (primpol)-like protein